MFHNCIKKKNCIDLISNLENIISCIRTQYPNLYFEHKPVSSKCRINQVQMSVRAIENTSPNLSYEKLKQTFPQNYLVKNQLKIHFKNIYFVLPIDHTQHETGSSHLDLKFL